MIGDIQYRISAQRKIQNGRQPQFQNFRIPTFNKHKRSDRLQSFVMFCDVKSKIAASQHLRFFAFPLINLSTRGPTEEVCLSIEVSGEEHWIVSWCPVILIYFRSMLLEHVSNLFLTRRKPESQKKTYPDERSHLLHHVHSRIWLQGGIEPRTQETHAIPLHSA